MTDNNHGIHPLVKSKMDNQNALGRIRIYDLSLNDVVDVRTKHSTYTFKITEISDKSHAVEVSSTNKKYAGPYADSRLIGTTITPGASIISPAHFAIGGAMEVALQVSSNKYKTLTTSEVLSVSVNGMQVLPVTDTNA
jgi:hypothetical protein